MIFQWNKSDTFNVLMASHSFLSCGEPNLLNTLHTTHKATKKYKQDLHIKLPEKTANLKTEA